MFRAGKLQLQELTPRRIALVKPSALGDIANSLPVLTALRRRFPDAHITWIVNRGLEPLLRGHPDLDETLPFDRQRFRRGFFRASLGFTTFLRRLRLQRFDLAVDLQGLLRTGLMSLATGAARRVGMSCAREGARWFYTDVVPVPDPENTHAVERTWTVARALGCQDDKVFRLPVDELASAWALEQLHGRPRPWLAVGVGARWLTKRWPPQHFAELLRRVQARFGGTAIFIGAAEEAPLAEATAAQIAGPALNLAGRTTLPQLAALLAQADVMLSNDTGPLHLAVALGRPVVAPYTCTQVKQNGPFGQAGRAVETAVWCRGSYLKKCSRMECMSELTPDRLWPVLLEVLEAWQRQSLSA
ncbi:MAG: glycosyltransferase family 9 protein [Planctomycetes bacterium]|nr:glycosyltransferase family 9 protein [Planctomycetota bacterium]